MHESHERDNLCHFRGERKRERKGNRERNENRSLWGCFVLSTALPSNETNHLSWKSRRNSKIQVTEMASVENVRIVFELLKNCCCWKKIYLKYGNRFSFFFLFTWNAHFDSERNPPFSVCLMSATLLAGRRGRIMLTLMCLSLAGYTICSQTCGENDARTDRHPREPLEFPSRGHPYFTLSPRGLINNGCTLCKFFILVIQLNIGRHDWLRSVFHFSRVSRISIRNKSRGN